jgi:hypothetical protein
MIEFELINKNDIKHCDSNDESIIAFKVFDQCRIKKCIVKGPTISAEECTCIILQPDEEDHLGRVILPNTPIYVPEVVTKLKVIGDSFKTQKIDVSSILPSPFKPGYWDVEIVFTFIFKVELFDIHMNKLEILCCPSHCNSIKECKHTQDYISGSVNHIEKLTLFGSTNDGPLIASDIILQNEPPMENSPHVLAESKAYFVDAALRSPKDMCLFEEILDDIYDEPIIYIYITIGLFMLVKLFKLASILVESKGYSVPKAYCCDKEEDDCELFSQIEFPYKDFSPPIKKPNCER